MLDGRALSARPRDRRLTATTNQEQEMHRPESPFPYRLPHTGAIVTDERCRCGALRTHHRHTLAFGHGPRIVDGVNTCERFTWRSHVFTTSGLPAGFERLDDKHAIKAERASARSVGAKGWRYEVRDMAARGSGGLRLFSCAVPAARSKGQAIDHARIELQRYLERASAQQTLGGVQ